MIIRVPFTGFCLNARVRRELPDAGTFGAVAQLLAVNLRIVNRRPFLAVNVLWLTIGAGWL